MKDNFLIAKRKTKSLLRLTVKPKVSLDDLLAAAYLIGVNDGAKAQKEIERPLLAGKGERRI